MIYAQFYTRNAIHPELIVEACGDRAVVIIDGRLSKQAIARIAETECMKRGYTAWAIFRGETFTRSHKVSGPWAALAMLNRARAEQIENQKIEGKEL